VKLRAKRTAPLHQVILGVRVARGHLLLLLPRDREDVVLHVHVDILRGQTRQFGEDFDRVGRLPHVHHRNPRARHRAGLIEEPVKHPVDLPPRREQIEWITTAESRKPGLDKMRSRRRDAVT
jgi:hypothetical protein